MIPFRRRKPEPPVLRLKSPIAKLGVCGWCGAAPPLTKPHVGRVTSEGEDDVVVIVSCSYCGGRTAYDPAFTSRGDT